MFFCFLFLLVFCFGTRHYKIVCVNYPLLRSMCIIHLVRIRKKWEKQLKIITVSNERSLTQIQIKLKDLKILMWFDSKAWWMFKLKAVHFSKSHIAINFLFFRHKSLCSCCFLKQFSKSTFMGIFSCIVIASRHYEMIQNTCYLWSFWLWERAKITWYQVWW